MSSSAPTLLLHQGVVFLLVPTKPPGAPCAPTREAEWGSVSSWSERATDLFEGAQLAKAGMQTWSLCSYAVSGNPQPPYSFTQQRPPMCVQWASPGYCASPSSFWPGPEPEQQLHRKVRGSVCVSPFRASSSLFPAYSSSCFLLPGASPPTQPRSDEVNNQGVSFKYQLAQWREPTCKERRKKKKPN